MGFLEVIQDNCKNHCKVSWWPRFAFHYTDVTNAVSILSEGTLFSRTDAQRFHIMQNDNASRQVIDMTNSNVVSMVRFYFRPLTPTQYYNEGYKHPALRYDGDENANTPVPIFFLFDLASILSLPEVQFSETSQAGYGATVFSGEEAFKKLNFDAIYSTGWEDSKQYKNYRHAEITHRGPLAIEPYLRTILCRNVQDRTTLLNLLRESDPFAYQKYRDIIKVYKNDTFQNNGLCVESCIVHENTLSITFSDSYQKQKYMDRMKEKLNVNDIRPISVRIECRWFNTRRLIYQESFSVGLDYANPGNIVIRNMPVIPNTRELGIKVFFDDKLVCYQRQSVSDSEVIK